MDYGPMIASHTENNADITVGVIRVPLHEATQFGVMTIDEDNRVTHFNEKPANPQPIPGNPDAAMASMGIYVFNREFLLKTLEADAADPDSEHDFGKNIIPQSIDNCRVFAYPFQDVKTRAQSYWRDVGPLDAYFRANLELIYVRPAFNLYDEDWPIWTYQEQLPPAQVRVRRSGSARAGCGFPGVRRLRHLRCHGAAFTAVLSRPRAFLCPDRKQRAAAGCGDRPACAYQEGGHRPGLRDPRGDGDR